MAKFEEVEDALLLWFKAICGKNVPVSGAILQAKASKLAGQLGIDNFQSSYGWLQRFKKRHGIVIKYMCGENASVSDTLVDNWLTLNIPTLLSGYEARNIYNADETGLFFRLLLDKTLIFKKESCHGGKHSKERITVLVGANVEGEKLPLLVIGKSKNPRCFKNVKSFPVQYTSSSKAWINSSIFESWLRKLDLKFRQEKRSILLFLDNCPAHPIIDGLTNIKVAFLPPNSTSKLQPMDQGIIRSLKAHYRKKLLSKLISALDKNEIFKVNLLDALHMINAAWNEVTVTTVKNCFLKA